MKCYKSPIENLNIVYYQPLLLLHYYKNTLSISVCIPRLYLKDRNFHFTQTLEFLNLLSNICTFLLKSPV